MVPKTTEQMVAGVPRPAAGVRAGREIQVQQLRLLPARRDHREGHGQEIRRRRCADEIFTPLGMTDTGYDWTDAVLPRRASGYISAAARLVNAKPLDMQQPYCRRLALLHGRGPAEVGSGALHRPCAAGGGSRRRCSRRSRTTTRTAGSCSRPSSAASGKAQVGHGGGINGFSTMIARVPDDKVVVIVLGNVDNVNAGNIARDLMSIVYGRPYQTPTERTAVAVKPEFSTQYVGRYQIGPDFVLTVTLEDGRLMTQATGPEQARGLRRVGDEVLPEGRGRAAHLLQRRRRQGRRTSRCTRAGRTARRRRFSSALPVDDRPVLLVVGLRDCVQSWPILSAIASSSSSMPRPGPVGRST